MRGLLPTCSSPAALRPVEIHVNINAAAFAAAANNGDTLLGLAVIADHLNDLFESGLADDTSISCTMLHRGSAVDVVFEAHRTDSTGDPRTVTGLRFEAARLRSGIEALSERVRHLEREYNSGTPVAI
jgi:hypothetical protein